MKDHKKLLKQVDELIGLIHSRSGEPEPLRPKVTLKDIADNAGVGIATATRYVNDKKFPPPCRTVKYRVGDIFQETKKRWFADEVDAWFAS